MGSSQSIYKGSFYQTWLPPEKTKDLKNEIPDDRNTLPKVKAEVFRTYLTLYNITDASGPHSTESLAHRANLYLDKADLPKLPEQAIQDLEGPITGEEWEDTLKHTQKGKALGPDGLFLIYYKTLSSLLMPQFLSAYNSLRKPHSPETHYMPILL